MTGKASQPGRPSSAGKEDLHRMQEDAVRRVQEMQNRARSHLKPPPPTLPDPTPVKPTQPAAVPSQVPPSDLFQTLFQDEERTLILSLLILLSGEKDNTELIFALLFLLL